MLATVLPAVSAHSGYVGLVIAWGFYPLFYFGQYAPILSPKVQS